MSISHAIQRVMSMITTFRGRKMDSRNINISQIVIDCFKGAVGIEYNKIAQKLECSQQTLLNWRTGSSKPNKGSKKIICERLPELLKNEEQRQACMFQIRESFSELDGRVKNALDACNSVSQMLEYLYISLEKEKERDKIGDLFNTEEGVKILKEIIQQKFKINKEKTPIFQIQKVELSKDGVKGWKLELNNSFILQFKQSNKTYAYNVLVNYSLNKKDYLTMGEYTEAKETMKSYGVKMILFFGNAEIPDNVVDFWMDYNIYMERISIQEIKKKKEGKDYIYNTQNTNFELEVLANQYADLVIERLKEYFYVVYKNILFSVPRILSTKQKDSRVFWDAKYATRHHINFEESRITFLINQGIISGNKVALAIGYLSFPCILRLSNRFEKIYLLDNSNTAIKVYEDYIIEYEPELKKKIEFVTFTSALSETITEKYQLYCSVDFILIGTGGGSFIRKIQRYYQMCNMWLQDKGVLYISFLNKEFLYEYVDRITAEENLEFVPDIERENAMVLVGNNTERYELYCKTCDSNELKDMAEKYFTVENMYSYPLACVMEGAHKSKLQNILKELDKEYSKLGIVVKNFSNSRGYYIDGVLKKHLEQYVKTVPLKMNDIQKVTLNDIDYGAIYLKTLLLAEKTPSRIDMRREDATMKIYVIVLSKNKRLPETTNQEICLGNQKLRLLEISEINKLGLEYKDISPFLEAQDNVELNFSYDRELKHNPNRYFYVGAGSNNQGYRIQGKKLIELLENYRYSASDI